MSTAETLALPWRVVCLTIPLLGLAPCGASDLFPASVPYGLDRYLPTPEDNHLTRARLELGRRLFFDPLLSRDRTLSCASCHQPRHRFTVPERFATGIDGQRTERNPPALVNRAYGRHFFWDGRAATLEAQALDPIQNPKEMDLSLEQLQQRLQRHDTYPLFFQQAFQRPPNPTDVGRALASYVRGLLSGDSPYDRYLFGDEGALSTSAKRGLQLFHGKANCSTCHTGPNLTDERFHNTGVAWQKGQLQDVGRFGVTKQDRDRGAFKTPTLRDVALTAPYMHDGSLATLEDVTKFYNRGGNTNPSQDGDIRALDLTADETSDLIEFLRSLTGRDVR